MEENKKNQKQNIKNSSAGVKQTAGFFRMTTQQISQNINKYENAISKDNTVFQSKLPENRPTSVVFKKRLNSLDSVMLEDAAYNVLDNEGFKLEKRIENINKTISEVEDKITVAKTVNDRSAYEELKLQKQILTENLKSAQIEYSAYNGNSKLISVVGKIFKIPSATKEFLLNYLINTIKTSELFKHIKPLTRSFMVRDTISKLNQINKSVDELVKMQIPFGEQEARYATLVNQLASAGALHSQILKEFEDI